MFIIWHQDKDGYTKLYSSHEPLRLGRQGRRLYQSNELEYLTIPGIHGKHLDTGTVLIWSGGAEEFQKVGKYQLVGLNNLDNNSVDLL